MSSMVDRMEQGEALLGGGQGTNKSSHLLAIEKSASLPPSRQSSRPASPTASDQSEDLPTNVSRTDQLSTLPEECLSGDKDRPLRHVTEWGTITNHSLNPMAYSVLFILIVELLERFAFYGINYTQTSYLTGAYDEQWNAGMHAVAASTYVSISVAVAYTTPFMGAYLADSVLGDYWSILCGMLCFYLPGLFLIAFTTIPGFLGTKFNKNVLQLAFLGLWPIGTGIVKSCVNVFGARQFHPLLQSSLIESYYVSFYMSINIGALVGGIAVPVLAQTNVTWAYFLPVAMLSVGAFVFLCGSPRYIKSRPLQASIKKKTASIPPPLGAPNLDLTLILRISLLVVPFNIAYSQMATTFIVQGNVMRKAFYYIDASTMNNTDAIAVLAAGYIIGNCLYPWLADRNIKIPTTYKFAMGSFLGALAILWALLVEDMIHQEYNATGQPISVLWQTLSYCLIGAGEIFAVSAAYEVAFTASPPEKKVLSSAVNLFCIGGLPNIVCIALYHVFRGCFTNSRGTASISHLHEYATAHVARYYWVLFAISMGGVLINLLPQVRRFVESVEDRATDLLKSPKTPQRPPRRTVEESPLLRDARHKAYLKYGSGPVLYKSGSMRAGPSVFGPKKKSTKKPLKRSFVSKLYKNEPVLPGVATLMMSSTGGTPIMAGQLLKKEMTEPKLTRHDTG